MTLSDAAERVIVLARKVRDYYAAELPKRHPNYPVIRLDEDVTPPPPEEKELKKFLATLSADVIYQLLLIMYLGRRDFGIDNLVESFESLKETFVRPEFAASQMLGKAPLAEYLFDGLEELRRHKIDVNKLRVAKPKARKA